LNPAEPAFEAADDAAEAGLSLTLDLEGFEGPLDLLLALARTQKVDLSRIALVPLVDQYLAFIGDVQGRRIDLAGDYLVMAAWLTLLKSKLLFPMQTRAPDEPDPEAIAAHLQRKLAHLAQARAHAALLFHLPQLDRDVFTFGAPTPVAVIRDVRWQASLFDLMSAYVRQRTKGASRAHKIEPRRIYPLEAARQRLEGALPELDTWRPLSSLRPPAKTGADGPEPASFSASLLGATLELVRDQRLQARQDAPFAPVFVRRRAPS
jgi:segregation and condensation protein A